MKKRALIFFTLILAFINGNTLADTVKAKTPKKFQVGDAVTYEATGKFIDGKITYTVEVIRTDDKGYELLATVESKKGIRKFKTYLYYKGVKRPDRPPPIMEIVNGADVPTKLHNYVHMYTHHVLIYDPMVEEHRVRKPEQAGFSVCSRFISGLRVRGKSMYGGIPSNATLERSLEIPGIVVSVLVKDRKTNEVLLRKRIVDCKNSTTGTFKVK